MKQVDIHILQISLNALPELIEIIKDSLTAFNDEVDPVEVLVAVERLQEAVNQMAVFTETFVQIDV